MSDTVFANWLAVAASIMLLILLSMIKPPTLLLDQPSLDESTYRQEIESFIQHKVSAILAAEAATNSESDQWSPGQIECLAANIYHEARGESLEGQVAVATVTLNRVGDSRWAATICEVVKQKTLIKHYDEQGEVIDQTSVCQFSWVCDAGAAVRRDAAAWRRSVDLANAVINGEYDHVAADYRDAFYFHADHVNPSWATRTTLIKQTGAHVFRGDV